MAAEDSGADLLWTTRNAFYVGAYQAAVADAADLEGLDEAASLERDCFVFRCYIELGSHEVREGWEKKERGAERKKKEWNERWRIFYCAHCFFFRCFDH